MAKSLYELKMDERKKSKPNLITDADYFLRDKKLEKEKGFPNTHDITGRTVSSQEEANDKKVRELQSKLDEMTKLFDALEDRANKETPNKRNTNQANKEVANKEVANKEVEGDK